MTTVFTGAASAISPGAADFMAGQSFERIGTPRVLARMLFVSTLVLTVYMLY